MAKSNFIRCCKLTILILLLSSCAAKQPFVRTIKSSTDVQDKITDDNIDYELFLVGDIGSAKNNFSESNIVDLIKLQIRDTGIKQSVIFLGNSISEDGLPDEEAPEFKKMDLEIKHCILTLKDYTDKVFFIPGNHEWYDGYEHTSSALNNVENYIESSVGGKNIFAPSHGCGEPKIIELSKELVLLLIDSQWILEGDRSGERRRSQCEIDYEAELIVYIKEKLSKHRNKNIIIAAHHPVFSNGKTGGNYDIASNLLPLPIIGSLITGIKKISGDQQRFGHPQYQKYREIIEDVLDDYKGVIHVSSHDKNLQYHLQNDNHFIVSGSGAATDYVRKGGTAEFAYMKMGFAKITHTKNLELWLEFYVPDPDKKNSIVSVFKKRLYKKELIDYTDTAVYQPLETYKRRHETTASETYSKKIPGMGNTYREEWGTKLNVPVLLLAEEHGGLTPIKQGGGFLTKSLRLENSVGHQWVLRSIDKDVTMVVPSLIRGTFAQDVVQDGISASHPYAAFAIPKIAAAANIYHANPRMVWVPKQKSLGDYNIHFGDRFFMLEEYAGGNMEGHPTFGGARKAISTPDLLENLNTNHKCKVDEKQVLRCRLFDLLIGDWDRHDDQWRWAEYRDERTGLKTYRAIPRDRDQTFFKNDGILNYIASRPYFNPQLRKFDSKIDKLSGLIYNARHFDRSFIAQLNKEDFVSVAYELQKDITNEVLEKALKEWPKQIYNISGAEILSKLKQRRDDLAIYAEEFYELISGEITVTATTGINIFNISALPNDQLKVEVFHKEQDKNNKIWSRTISGEDCKELRLYGLNNKDTFNFIGSEESSIKIHLVGGPGNDKVNNYAQELNILVYDRNDGMDITGYKIKSRLKNRRGVNRYNRLDWELDRTIHFPMIDFYTDEGAGLAYNIWWKKNGFRENPYKSNHTFSISYFTANSSLVAEYTGHWVSVFNEDWDIRLSTEATGPVFTQFYYGPGNEYKNYEKLLPNEPEAGTTQFFMVRGSHVYANPQIVGNIGSNRSISIEPSGEFLNIKNRPEDPNDSRFIFLEEAGLSNFDFENKFYLGIGAKFTSDRINSPIIPTRGYKFQAGFHYRQSLSNSEFRNMSLESNLTSYIPFSPTHRLVLATDLGAAYTIGKYEFFHANYLATRERMRGFRRNRFSGDGIAFIASDLRFKIYQGRSGMRTGLGLFGAYDIGRAFSKGDNNNEWHTSIGGGIFLTPIDLIGFKIGYYVGEDDRQLVIGGSLSF